MLSAEWQPDQFYPWSYREAIGAAAERVQTTFERFACLRYIGLSNLNGKKLFLNCVSDNMYS